MMNAILRLSTPLFLVLFTQSVAVGDERPITRSAHLPDTLPWNLEELSACPEYQWEVAEGAVRTLFYAGEPYQGRATRVFAYYATPGTLTGRPDAAGSLPAVVLVHGGGGTAFREWVELWAKKGYAAIAMDLAGHRPIEGQNAHDPKNRTRLEDGGPGQGDDVKFGAVDEAPEQQWPYHAVASVLRAHSLIRSFPEVDAQRTAVTGISWGGYLTCIVAGVDNRFRAAVPVYGCGFLEENSIWLDRFAKMTPQQRQRWTNLWDPSRYLPAVSMPILFVNGTNDVAYPLDSHMKSYDLVPGEKQLCITVNMPHGHPQGWAPQEIFLFIDHCLRGGKALPAVEKVDARDGKVSLTYRSDVPLKAAALHWTTDSGPMTERKWATQAADIVDGHVEATEPRGAVAWFLSVTDERGALVSSRVQWSETNDSPAE